MRVAVFILLLGLQSNVHCQPSSDSIIYWSQCRKLNWADFRGNFPDSLGYEVAVSSTQILIQAYWDGRIPDYKVFAVFKRYDSWSKDTSRSVLAHEQLHFDIGELFARRARKALLKLQKKNDDSVDDYLQIIYSNIHECDSVEAVYDAETAHGVYRREQEEWSRKIAVELGELKDFEVDYTEYLSE